MEAISTVSAEFEHAAIEADSGINVGGLEIKVLPECQLGCESFEEKDGWRVEPFITNHGRIIDERGVGRCISRWDRYAIVRCDPKRRRA